jgi:hypothetical protein
MTASNSAAEFTVSDLTLQQTLPVFSVERTHTHPMARVAAASPGRIPVRRVTCD